MTNLIKKNVVGATQGRALVAFYEKARSLAVISAVSNHSRKAKGERAP